MNASGYKVVLVFFGGLFAALAFILYAKHAILTPKNLFFFTVEAESRKHGEVVKRLVKELNGRGLKVIRILPMSDVLHQRGVKDFPNYTTVLACDIPEKKGILLRVPFMNVLIPCTIAVYEEEGKVKLTALKEHLFLQDFAEELGEKDTRLISDVYQKLRTAMVKAAGVEKR